MRSPEDALLMAMSHGMEGWMLGTATDAPEIATYGEMTGNRAIPRTPEAIDRMLSDLHDAGLVAYRSRPHNVEHEPARYRSYALTEDGWARARELEAPVD